MDAAEISSDSYEQLARSYNKLANWRNTVILLEAFSKEKAHKNFDIVIQWIDFMKIPNNIFMILSQSKLFWIARLLSNKLAFLVHRKIHNIRARANEQSIRSRVFGSLVFGTIPQISMGIIIATLLQAANSYAVPLFSTFGFVVPATDSEYGTLLATITGIGGLFIGLYYTATSLIAGTAYSRAPANIRQLFAQERSGNVYMHFLFLVTYTALALLAYQTLGFPPSILAVPVLLLATGVAIVSFVRLGTRAFDLFDPTSLASIAFERLTRSCDRMAAGNYLWSNLSFQSHANRTAKYALSDLDTIATTIASERHLSGQPYAQLCKNILSFLRWYEPKKRRIPTSSLWYERKPKHPLWYKTQDHETSMAHTTGTSLTPKYIENQNWIEERLLPIVYECIKQNLKESRFDEAISLLNHIDAYTKQLAQEHQVERAIEVIEDLYSCCSYLLHPELDKISNEELLSNIAFADAFAAIPINLLLGYVASIKEFDRKMIVEEVAAINWKSGKGIFQARLPAYTLNQLQWLQSTVDFEVQAETIRVSPDWYLAELVIQKVCENTKSAAVSLVKSCHSLYEKFWEEALSTHHYWIAAAVLARRIEYSSKLGSHLSAIIGLWDNLNGDRKLKDLPWPLLDTNDLETTRKAQTKSTILEISKLSIALSISPQSDNFPDFAGMFLHFTGEDIIKALHENDTESVTDLFGTYLPSSFLQYQKLLSSISKAEETNLSGHKIAASVLMDLMEISGYAYFYADFYNNSALSNIVTTSWNEYIMNLENGETSKIIPLLAASVGLTESGFEIPHRGVLRTGWSRLPKEAARTLPKVVIRGSAYTTYPREKVIHESPLVRLFANESVSSLYNGIDIFIWKFVRNRNDGKTADFGGRRRDLADDIQRQIDLLENNDKAEDDEI